MTDLLVRLKSLKSSKQAKTAVIQTPVDDMEASVRAGRSLLRLASARAAAPAGVAAAVERSAASSPAAATDEAAAAMLATAAAASLSRSGSMVAAASPGRLRRVHSRVSDDPVVFVEGAEEVGAGWASPDGHRSSSDAGGELPWKGLVRRVTSNRITLHAPAPSTFSDDGLAFAAGGDAEPRLAAVVIPGDALGRPAPRAAGSPGARLVDAFARTLSKSRRSAGDVGVDAVLLSDGEAVGNVVGAIHFSGGSARLMSRVASRGMLCTAENGRVLAH